MLDGGWTISPELFRLIVELFPPNRYPRMLEFGSGHGSQDLVDAGYELTSIEHDKTWLGIAKGSNYIYAPLIDRWYTTTQVVEEMRSDYDIWLIDGPPGAVSDRIGAINNMPSDVYWPKVMICDDTHRPNDKMVADKAIAKAKKKNIKVIGKFIVKQENPPKEAIVIVFDT